MPDVAKAYDAASENALARWKECPDVGRPQPPPFHPDRLAVTTGDRIVGTAPLLALQAELHNVVRGDSLADMVPSESRHFTFLALSLQAYELRTLPLPDSQLTEMFREHCQGRSFSISKLRLVALPNALLLAGIPDSEALELRERFTRMLLCSEWRTHLIERHSSLPPLFWHTTLLRYSADFVSKGVRDFFIANRGADYGEVTVPIRLVAANYNWQHIFYLDEQPAAAAKGK